MRIIALIALGALLALQFACQLSVNGGKPFTQAQNNASLIDQGTPAPILDPEFIQYWQLVQDKFIHRDFDWIEKEVSRLKSTKERVPGGYWKLRILYKAIASPLGREGAPEPLWPDHIKILEGWSAQHPGSIVPRIALANSWSSYGWAARGHGFAKDVAASNWEAYFQRIAKAQEALGEAAELHEQDPEWYLAALTTTLESDRDVYDRVFQQAIAIEPTYYYFYQAKAKYLLPRWHGEAGEWERFAEQSSDAIGGEQGDIIFFAIYTFMLSQHEMSFLNDHKEAGPRVVRGFRAIEKLYGATPHLLSQACLFSFSADDKQTAGELMQRIGENYDADVWRSRATFNEFREAALGTK